MVGALQTTSVKMQHEPAAEADRPKSRVSAFYHILRSIKTRFTQGRLFYTQGPFFCTLGPLFSALVREEAIFAVCKRCANEGFACLCKEKDFSAVQFVTAVQ